MGKKRDGWSSPLLRLQKLLEKDHEFIWERLLYCKRYMDETYFCQLCQYLWQYIVYGIELDFENPVMQNTLLEFMKSLTPASPERFAGKGAQSGKKQKNKKNK